MEECFVGAARLQVFRRIAELFAILGGKIDAVDVGITSNILPEVGELQSRADRIRPLGVPFAELAADVKHQSADRVGTASAVIAELIERVVSLNPLILLEGGDQILERLPGDLAFLDRLLQCDKHGMPGGTGVAISQFAPPPVQEFQRSFGSLDFIPQIIRPAAEGIDAVEVLMKLFGKQPGDDGEVFVVDFGELGAVGLGLGERDREGRNCLRPPFSQSLFKLSIQRSFSSEKTVSRRTLQEGLFPLQCEITSFS